MSNDEAQPAPLSREHRRAERARVVQLSKLPFLYDFALRGLPQAIVAVLLQSALAIAIGLLIAKVATGEWLPGWILFLVLAVSFALQGAARYLNAQAGRR